MTAGKKDCEMIVGKGEPWLDIDIRDIARGWLDSRVLQEQGSGPANSPGKFMS